MIGAPSRWVATPDRWVGDPILIHLNLLLNTRVGSVPHLPDYGVPDMSSFYSDYPASRVRLAALLQALIKRYEPRLKDPYVRPIGYGEDDFRLSFLIKGRVEEGDDVADVEYRTMVSSNGQTIFKDFED